MCCFCVCEWVWVGMGGWRAVGWLVSSGEARGSWLEAAQLRGGGVCHVERQQAAIVTKPNAASGDHDEAERSKRQSLDKAERSKRRS